MINQAYRGSLHSMIGTISLYATETSLTQLTIGEVDLDSNPNDIIVEASQQLQAFFSGRLKSFDLPLDLSCGTDFQQEVWQAVLDIPYGQTRSYGDIARLLDNPGAIRAIGRANGANPIPIIVPCHRVIGSDGSLTGYVYGTEVKRRLLAIENQDRWSATQTRLF